MSSMGLAPLAAPHHGIRITSLDQLEEQAIGELRNYIQTVISGLSVTQIPGFSNFTAKDATPATAAEATSSTSPADLSTPGPVLASLPDGKYVFLFRGGLKTSNSPAVAYMGVKVNTTEPTTTEAIFSDTPGGFFPGMGWVLKTLANGGSNTVTARYWITDAAETGTFRDRRLLAFRVSN